MNYYIAYSFIENENSANQIQSKNTFENLSKLDKNIRGIFFGNKGSKTNPLWPIRQENNKFFIDRFDFADYWIEKIFKLGIIRKNFFPFLFAHKCGKILKEDKNKKNIYIRPGNVEEAIFYLKRLNQLNINKITFELHNLPFAIPKFYRWNLEKKYCYQKYAQFFSLAERKQNRTRLVSLTKALKDTIKNKFNYKGEIIVIPDAHNLIIDRPKEINFNKEKIEIIYTGLSFANKGVEDLIEALNFLNKKIFLRLVGGHDIERSRITKKYQSLINDKKLIVEEPVVNEKIREKLRKADIAIIPSPENAFTKFSSPLKLFDYMAAGIPIIASNLPALREILTENNALFFEPGNVKDLAKKINYLANNEKMAKNIGQKGFEDSKKYTYLERAKKIYKLFLK